MKIAIVHSSYDERELPSGENSAVQRQGEALMRAGHDVEFFLAETSQLSQSPFFRLRSALRTAAQTGAAIDLARLSNFDPQILHVHNLFPNIGAGSLRPWRGRIVSTLHNFRWFCAAATLMRENSKCTLCVSGSSWNAVRYKCYRSSAAASIPLAFSSRRAGSRNRQAQLSSAIITLNAEAAALVSERFPDTLVEQIPNFVFDSPQSQTSNGRWLYAGRLSSEKGIQSLLTNWPESSDIDLVGSGPLVDLVEAQCSIRPNMRFLGYVDNAALRRVLPSYRGVVLPSLWPEGLPTILLEACAAGLPSAISVDCAIAADFERRGAAIRFDPRSSAQTQLAISEIEARAKMMAAAARALFDAEYGEAQWVDRVTSLYEQILPFNHDILT